MSETKIHMILWASSKGVVMSFVASRLTVLFLAVAALFIGSAGAQAQTFTFKVCNTSPVNASVSIAAHVSPTNKAWMAQGWWVVNAGECSTIGEFPIGWFYYYAKATDRDWHGSGADSSKTCVEQSPFKRSDPPGYTCASSETLVNFAGKLIESGGGTFTWTLD